MSEKQAKKRPVVVSILNLKGGVGKTTVAALLARYVSGTGGYGMRRGQRELDVLAVDLDPQANLSQALMGEQEYKKFHAAKKPSIVELFKGYVSPSADSGSPSPVESKVVQTIGRGIGGIGRLEIIPSRFDFSHHLVDTVSPEKEVLARFISTEMAHKDLVIIDCAPTESVLTHAAYHASRYILIPVRTEFLATIGFPLMQESLEDFRRRNRGSAIEVCGVLVNRNRTSGVGKGPHHRDAMQDIKGRINKNGWPIIAYMDHSDGYPKWAKDPNATHLGNAYAEWPRIAKAILVKIGLM